MTKVLALLVCVMAFNVMDKAWAASEAEHVAQNCKGLIEFRLPDGARVDCIAGGYAIEYDWSKKWAEAIGQSLYYAQATQMKAGIVLIKRVRGGDKHIARLRAVIDAYDLPIRIEIINEIIRANDEFISDF